MKSSSTIDLMKTVNGYSIIENDVTINKPAINVNFNQPPLPSTTYKYNKQQKAPQILPKKFIPQQTFTIYPYIYSKPAQNHPYLIIPSRSQWFNVNSINEIQRKSLPEWFKQKKGVMATVNNMKFQKNEDIYKKYRNYIIDLGKSKYVTATMARKGLAGDTCAIIRIHQFLANWGLINFVHKRQLQNHQNQKAIEKEQNCKIEQTNNLSLKRKDGFDKDKTIISKIYDKDDLQLLKKITKKFRPACTSCQSICGIAWYEYKDTLTKKQFLVNEQTSTTTVISSEQFEYHLRICFSCYVEKNYPVVLGSEDFTKKTLLEQIKRILFDQKFGIKKLQEWTRIADVLEKNKFNIGKCAQVLKIYEHELLDFLMQMPVQNLQKLSRIEQQTEDEAQNLKSTQVQVGNGKQNSFSKDKNQEISLDSNEEIKMFERNLQTLGVEQRQIYEEFLQAWLLKIYTKLQQLQRWDKSVQWKIEENESIKRQNIADKIKQNMKLYE